MIRVDQSTVIDAPIHAVWQILRDFNSHRDWHPAIAESEIELPARSDQVGAVRRFRLQDGGELTERLLSLSDRDFSLRYCLHETPVPLQDYVAEIQLKPVTDGNKTFWQWSSRFNTPPGQEHSLKSLVEEQIYQAGFAAIQERLGEGGHRSEPGSVQSTTPAAEDPRESAPVRFFGYGNSEALPINAGVVPQTSAQAVHSQSGSEICNGIIIDRHGGADELRFREIALPPPGRGEVQVRHHAIGVNYIDVYCRTGHFGFVQPPGGLGMEAAGEIVGIGDGVTGWQPGDRAAYAAPPVGAYAERRNIDHQVLVRIPDAIDFDTAAAVMLKGMTAEFLLHRVYQLKPGDTILVHAAAGGVGLLLCQWASALGATVLGTVSTKQKARLASANGCAHPIFYTRENFVERVMQLTDGKGVDAVFDAVGRPTFGQSVEAVRVCGHVVSFGQADEPLGEWDIGAFAAKSITLSRPNFGNYTDTPEKIRQISDNLFRALANGTIRVHIGQRFSLAQAADAHRALESRATTGSTILIPDPTQTASAHEHERG